MRINWNVCYRNVHFNIWHVKLCRGNARKKTREKVRIIPTLDIQRTDQSENKFNWKSRIANIKSSVYVKPVVTIPEKTYYFTSDWISIKRHIICKAFPLKQKSTAGWNGQRLNETNRLQKPMSVPNHILITLKCKSLLGMDFFQAIFFSKILKDNLKGLQTWAFFKGQCYQKSNLKLIKGFKREWRKKVHYLELRNKVIFQSYPV